MARVGAMVLMVSWMVTVLLSAPATAEYALEGEEFSLSCTSGGLVQYWMLNGNGKAFHVGVIYEKESINVFSNGTIQFLDVKVEYDGEHLCVTKVKGEISGHSVQMQVRPKPPQDLWNNVYKGQFITGLVAALLCAFIFTAGCLVFRYRYKEPKTVMLIGEEGGHYNPALEGDVDAKGEHTKM